MRRTTGLLVGALLLLTLDGCGGDGFATDPSSRATQADSSVRQGLADGLAVTSQANAELVETEGTTLTPVVATWLHGWQIFDVETHWENDPVRFYAALSDDDTVLTLSGNPDSFAQMVGSAQVTVDDASVAFDVATVYLDVTRGFEKYSYRIDSISDIRWLPVPEPDEEQRQAELEAQYAALIQPPVAQKTDAGWSVTVWMVCDRSLVRHDLEIATDGTVQDSPEVVEAEIPVPWSV